MMNEAEYYSEKRWENWMNEIEQTDVDFEKPETLRVFDNLVNDVAITCFRILEDVSGRKLKKEKAVKKIQEVKDLIFRSHDFKDETKNMMMEFVKNSLYAILNSAEYRLAGKKSSRKPDELLKEAIEQEKKGNLDKSLDLISRIGAHVLSGNELPEMNIPEEDLLTLNWFDGIETLNTVLLTFRMDEG